MLFVVRCNRKTLKAARRKIRIGLVGKYAARADIAVHIILYVGIRVDGYSASASMNKAEPFAGRVHFRYDAHVVNLMFAAVSTEEYQVAFAQVGQAHFFSFLELVARGAPDAHAFLLVHIARKSRAVKRMGAAVPATVAFAQVFDGRVHDFVARSRKCGDGGRICHVLPNVFEGCFGG